MATKGAVHTFQEGMIKDLDKSLVSKNSYLEARNFRLTSHDGESVGALENIKGNNLIVPVMEPGDDLTVGNTYFVAKGTATYIATPYSLGQSFTATLGNTEFSGAGSYLIDCNYIVPEDMYVCGNASVRDTIVLFLTSNYASVSPSGRNMIVKLVLDTVDETIASSSSVLYDDSQNNNTGNLGFCMANIIRAVGIYETPTIQKIYWCDGVNNIRYINISDSNTINGFYISPDLFEFIPESTMTKPELEYLYPGAITAGTVQYAFQYYTEHGAETTISPLSNTIHITTEDDFQAGSYYYKGEGDLEKTTGKSVRMSFSIPDSDRFTHIRVIRLHYKTINSVPTITIVGEVPISSVLSTVSFLDNGNTTYGVLTLDEFNIGQTELFSAKDIAIKNGRLFAANISKEEFSIGDWDSRAVRFRSNEILESANVITNKTLLDSDADVTIVKSNNNSVNVTITNFPTYMGIPEGRTIISVPVPDYSSTGAIGGTWHEVDHTSHGFSSNASESVFSNQGYTGTTYTFTITTSGSDYFTASYNHMDYAGITNFSFSYEYSYIEEYNDAVLYQDPLISYVTISKPSNPLLTSDWNIAGWNNYDPTHDGINIYNDPANDGDETYKFVYQADCSTLGAEGPNITIGFTTVDMDIDESENSGQVFSAGRVPTADNMSYTSFASPYMSGKRSWQRDETYRLYIVFFNEHGIASPAKWVCDLRMPSLHETNYRLTSNLFGQVTAKALYPTVKIKSFPTGAVSAQLLRVERAGEDRSVLTQAAVIPTGSVSAATRPKTYGNALDISGGITKLVSPEINIFKNITKGSSDYLEYVSDFDAAFAAELTEVSTYIDYYKMLQPQNVAYSANTKAVIDDSVYIEPKSSTDTFSFHATTCANYDSVTSAVGCSGLWIHHTNGSWSANGVKHVVVNYKRDVHASQYGGQTFESREGNIAIPASDVIALEDTEYIGINGDTFINFFEVTSEIFDLTKGSGLSLNENIYIPLESSINCELRHDRSASKAAIDVNRELIQETAGKWTNASGEIYDQTTSLYQYNTVYSQDSTAKFYVNVPSSVSTDTEFDCMIRVSKVKLNGESQDSWTLFPINDFIEVDTSKGPVTTLLVVGDKLLFWQETGFGVLSVNERSLIQDAGGASLVLGTGGVLDRYDYISDNVGATDNQHVVTSQTGVYWLNRKDKSIYRFAQGLANISKSKLVQSWLEDTLYPATSTDNVVRTAYDIRYNQVLFSFYDVSEAAGETLVFDETIDQFLGFFDFYTLMFIPHREGYLTTKHLHSADQLFYHNSELKDRCCFYSMIPSVGDNEYSIPNYQGSKYVNSSVKVLFNDDYGVTKAFDDLSFVSTASVNDIEVYNNTFSSIRCYNNYQNTDYCTLTYGTNLERDEREWTTVVPRNAVNKNYTTNPDIFAVANITKSREFKERMRDKYMITDFTYTNTSNRRFVVPYIIIKYRSSYR